MDKVKGPVAKKCNRPEMICHPERLKKIEVFRKESKELRIDLNVIFPLVRRFFDSADAPLRMTDLLRCAFFGLLIQVDENL